MRQTKTDAEMAAAENEFGDDPERAEVLHRARRFKSSWIELAESLTRVRRSGQWKAWGHPSFEVYAKNELHLRQETVDKLTGSFAFLQKRAPEVLSRDGVRAAIPTYHAVDFLRRAEEQEDAPREAADAIRKKVLEDATPITQVSREFKNVVFQLDPEDQKKKDVAAIKNVATRLREILSETRVVSRSLANDVGEGLDRLLEALEAEKPEKKRQRPAA